jgi:hypothetical protein
VILPTSFLLLSTLGQPPATFASAPQSLVSQSRLALTPILDGTLAQEEWEQLTESNGRPLAMQWEPEVFYWGGKLKKGEALVVTLDSRGDGWLEGDDNYEIIYRYGEGTVTGQVRRMSARQINGPQWIETRVFPTSHRIKASATTDEWTVEAAFTPTEGQTPDVGQRVGIRMDVVANDQAEIPPFFPRALNFVRLQWDTSNNLFSGLSWRPQLSSRSFAREDQVRLRYNFVVSPEGPALRTIDVRPEGLATGVMSSTSNPFPRLGRGGRAFVDYESKIDGRATNGYRVLRATLTTVGGQQSELRTSFRIADLLDIDVNVPQTLELRGESRLFRGAVVLRSQASGRMDGQLSLEVPSEWSISRGQNSRFQIYNTRGSWRGGIDFIIPRGTNGVFPLTFTAKIGERIITRTKYILVRS